ncbi:MAG: hypothetical protein Q8S04_05265 [Bacteroidales bacterium]|nr:hypothetical protein [Bacteroidales bacterium]
MKTTFNITRFGKLFKKEFVERAPVIFKMMAVISLILIGIWLTSILFGTDIIFQTKIRSVYIYLIVFGTAVVAPFAFYNDFNHTKKGLDYISLPASISEKFLSMFVLSLIIIPVIAFITVMFADTTIAIISPTYFSGFIFSDNLFFSKLFYSIPDLFILPSMCFLGNLIYRNNKVVKTFLSAAGVYILLAAILVFLFQYLFKTELNTLGSNFNYRFDNLINLYQSDFIAKFPVMKFATGVMALLYNFGIPAAALTGAYYRIKNIQY